MSSQPRPGRVPSGPQSFRSWQPAIPRRPTWPRQSSRVPEPPLPRATVSADRAREMAQAYLSRNYQGLFALPALLGALDGREVWFVKVGRLGTPEAVGELAIDAASGELGDVRLA